MRCCLSLAVLAGLLVSGCGGGGNSGPIAQGDGGGGSDWGYGPFVGRAASTNPPLHSTSSQSSATAIIGQFTSLRTRYETAPEEEWRLLTSNQVFGGVSRALLAVEDKGRDVRNLGFVNVTSLEPNSAGTAVIGTQPNPSDTRIVQVNLDTLAVTPMTAPPSGYSDRDPTFTDIGHIAFVRSTGNDWSISTISTALGPVTTVFSGSGLPAPMLPRVVGDYVFYWRGGQFWRVKLDGTGATNFLATPGSIIDWDLSTDGLLGVYLQRTDTEDIIHLFNPTTSIAIHTVVTEVNGVLSSVELAPDESKVVFAKSQGSFGNVLYTVDSRSWFQSPYCTLPLVTVNRNSAWIRGPRDRVFIGSGSILAASVADGVILGRQDDYGTCALVFDATTPGSIVARKLTDPVGNPDHHTFSVDADSLSYVAFGNAPRFARSIVVGAGGPVATANGFLVDIEAQTGEVSMVLPFTGARSETTMVQEGGVRKFRGQFLAVFDGEGNNLAPNGANEVTVGSGRPIIR